MKMAISIYFPFSIREKVAESRMREKPFNNNRYYLYNFSFSITPFSLTCPSDILSLRERMILLSPLC
jgi:hypothetical protein